MSAEQIDIDDAAVDAIASIANGDARTALNILELASQTSIPGERITPEVVQQAAQRQLLYDKGGEEHYNIISALHKSLRNSDVDAALYWLARMLEAGEDPNRYNPDGNHGHSTPLHQAAFAGHETVVRLLVERGARLDIRDTVWHGTPLGWALHSAKPKQLAIAAYLREHGATD